MTIKVDKNVPMPHQRADHSHLGKYQFTFMEMAVGESVFIPFPLGKGGIARLSALYLKIQHDHGKKFTRRKQGTAGYRIWRTA
jgi:hypothetical protein